MSRGWVLEPGARESRFGVEGLGLLGFGGQGLGGGFSVIRLFICYMVVIDMMGIFGGSVCLWLLDPVLVRKPLQTES